MEVKNSNTILKVTLSTDNYELITELANSIGCGRSSVANYLLSRSLLLVRQVPPKTRVKKLQLPSVIRDHDAFMQNVVRRAVGPSVPLISMALNSLMVHAETHYDPDL